MNVSARARIGKNFDRHLPIPAQRDRLAAKLVGHYGYYGITGNFMPLQQYFRQVTKIWRKWLLPSFSSGRR
jgi:hypothetical protein